MRVHILALFALASALPVRAEVIRYYLHDAHIGESYATGLFAFDTVGNRAYSLIPDVEQTLNPMSFYTRGPGDGDLAPILFFPVTGDSSFLGAFGHDERFLPGVPWVHLSFASPLGSSTSLLNPSDSYVRLGGSGTPFEFLYFTSGFVSTTPTSAPEPSTLTVMLLPLLIWGTRRAVPPPFCF